MIYLVILLGIIIGILCYLLSKKVAEDKETEQKNQKLKEEYSKLADMNVHLSQDIDNHKADLEYIKDQIWDKQDQLKYFDKLIENNKNISQQAFEEYWNNLENAYSEAEEDFDTRVNNLKANIQREQAELDKLKATRAAAHEAMLREQEVKDNKDAYRLIVPENEKRDIKLLNSIKKELINERPVNMIIWQTYYSKRANELCSRILGTSNKIGIYKITQISTDKCYIGQSKNIKDRFRDHMKCGLGIDTPAGNKLYKAMLDSSIEDFTFELIEECDEKDLDEKEKYFISLYQSYDYGFNSNRGNINGKS